jgi:hypothetical protein
MGNHVKRKEILKHGTDKLITVLIWVTNRCLNGEKVIEYKYLGIIFVTSGTCDKEIRFKVIQGRKCTVC